MFPANIPWWRSRIIIGAAISILFKILVMTNIIDDMVGLDTEQLTDAAFLAISGIADMWVIRERLVQKAAPAITAT